MVLIHCAKHLSSYVQVYLMSLLPDTEPPAPGTGEELVISASGGVSVSTADDTDIEIRVYLGNTELDATWLPIHTGEILIGEQGVMVGSINGENTDVLVEPGRYRVFVYTDTRELYSAMKVAFVLEKIA